MLNSRRRRGMSAERRSKNTEKPTATRYACHGLTPIESTKHSENNINAFQIYNNQAAASPTMDEAAAFLVHINLKSTDVG